MKTRQSIVSVALMLIALSAPIAHSRSPSGEPMDVSIDEMKRMYLWCDRAAISGQLNTDGIMQCSIVYEELKRRAFGGDFDKMLAWFKANATVQIAGQ